MKFKNIWVSIYFRRSESYLCLDDVRISHFFILQELLADLVDYLLCRSSLERDETLDTEGLFIKDKLHHLSPRSHSFLYWRGRVFVIFVFGLLEGQDVARTIFDVGDDRVYQVESEPKPNNATHVNHVFDVVAFLIGISIRIYQLEAKKFCLPCEPGDPVDIALEGQTRVDKQRLMRVNEDLVCQIVLNSVLDHDDYANQYLNADVEVEQDEELGVAYANTVVGEAAVVVHAKHAPAAPGAVVDNEVLLWQVDLDALAVSALQELLLIITCLFLWVLVESVGLTEVMRFDEARIWVEGLVPAVKVDEGYYKLYHKQVVVILWDEEVSIAPEDTPGTADQHKWVEHKDREHWLVVPYLLVFLKFASVNERLRFLNLFAHEHFQNFLFKHLRSFAAKLQIELRLSEINFAEYP